MTAEVMTKNEVSNILSKKGPIHEDRTLYRRPDSNRYGVAPNRF